MLESSSTSTGGTGAMPAFGAAEDQQVMAVSKSAKSKTIGFLISYDGDKKGEFLELSVGRWLLTSSPNDDVDYIYVNDAQIAPLHAIIVVNEDGRILVLDQLSENGTWHIPVNSGQERQVYGELLEVAHGDRFRFGKREFTFCLIPTY